MAAVGGWRAGVLLRRLAVAAGAAPRPTIIPLACGHHHHHRHHPHCSCRHGLTLRRGLHSTGCRRADFDPNILASADGTMPSLVTAYSHRGFVVSGHRIRGHAALLPKNMLAWKVEAARDITPESLAVFALHTPPIELLVVGTGDEVEPIPEAARQFLRDHNILVEVASTKNAIASYNFLSEENRQVGAALFMVSPGAAAQR